MNGEPSGGLAAVRGRDPVRHSPFGMWLAASALRMVGVPFLAATVLVAGLFVLQGRLRLDSLFAPQRRDRQEIADELDVLLAVSPVYDDLAGKGLMTTLAMPVLRDGKVAGAVSIDLVLTEFNRLLAGRQPEVGVRYLVDRARRRGAVRGKARWPQLLPDREHRRLSAKNAPCRRGHKGAQESAPFGGVVG